MDKNLKNKKKITLGLAMSGAAARSVFYIGFLEAMQENNIEVDFITAFSGASIVSAAYATGKLAELRDEALALNSKTLLSLLKRSSNSGGWYSLDPFEEYFRDKYTLGKNLEEVTPRLCFLATDVETKQSVELSLGDIARAVRISCGMPGVFEPVKWGNMLLVDGGLVTTVPGEYVRKSGADLVIGVQVRSNKYFFIRNEKVMDKVRELLLKFSFLRSFDPWFRKIRLVLSRIDVFGYLSEIRTIEKEDSRNIGIFSILGKCLDIAVEASERQKEIPLDFGCDLLISTGTAATIDSVNVHAGRKMYENGLRVGREYAPQIKSLIEKKQREKEKLDNISLTETYAGN